MGIHYHRARRADVLADGLAELLAAPSADPFAAEIVCVPTRGVERFLSQRLALRLGVRGAGRDGVCANVRFPSPGELFAGLSEGSGPSPDGGVLRQPRDNPWQEERLVWSVASVLPVLAGQPGCEMVGRHLAGRPESHATGGLLATSGRVARLLLQYQDERPTEVAGWAAERPDVPPDCFWQVLVWRELLARLGPGPALELPRDVARLQDDPDSCGLPGRISLFGPTRLSMAALELLKALGEAREVHLWLIDPSPASWGNAPRHPLLASAGRDFAALTTRLQALPHHQDALHSPAPPETLLGYLQADISSNRPPQPRMLRADDDSLQIHACHGQARQAEVVCEVVLGLLQSDPSLEPRDILIMCPDLDTFAPLFSAAFAERPDQPAMGALRLRIADRTPEQANEVLGALAQLLDLLAGRVTIGALLDLLAAPAVARRFDLDDDGLSRLRELCQAAGVLWGLDSTTRAHYSMPDVDLGTWAFGLDRILLGVALGEDELETFGDVLPLDDVGSSDLGIIGALAQVVTKLRDAQGFLAGTHPIADWVAVLTDLATFLAEPPADGAWMATHAATVLRAPLLASLEAGSNPGSASAVGQVWEPVGDISAAPVPVSTGQQPPQLAIDDVRWLLSEALAGRPTRANFRTGGLTVAGLVPMRSVPHRVIVLVGLDDGIFPRGGVPDGDDLLAREPRPGERNARSEDRQLFLDAIMAAQDHLVITYCGADDRTNEIRPPAVPVAELLDVLAATVITGPEVTIQSRLVVRHPLQPFDPRNFSPGALVAGRAFSHDQHALAGAIAAAGDRTAAQAFLPSPLPGPADQREVTLLNLAQFLADPLEYFLRYRLGLPARGHQEPPPDRLPVSLVGLSAWAVGDRLLDGMSHGHQPIRLAEVERLRGAIPPGELGTTALRDIGPKALQVHTSACAFKQGSSERIRVNLTLRSGVRLTGTVTDVVIPVRQAGTVPRARIVHSSYSKFKPGHLLRLWVHMLAANLCQPDLALSGVLVAQDGVRALVAPDPQHCAEHLSRLCGLLLTGLSEPMPMPPAPAYEYALYRSRGQRKAASMRKAQEAWSSKFGPAASPAAVRIYGPEASINVLTDRAPHPTETVPGEDNRFAALARLAWDPLLAATVDPESLVEEVS
jgi:exodeoxyribonuclease V gamma subunit